MRESIYDGNKFLGFWDCDSADGFGKLSFTSNFASHVRQIECCYGHGYPSGTGFGRDTYKDSTVFEGFMMDGKCHGLGCLKNENGSFLQGHWRFGKLVLGFIFNREGNVLCQFQRKQKKKDSVRTICKQISKDLELDQHLLERDVLLLNKVWHPNLRATAKLRNHTILELPSMIEERLQSHLCCGIVTDITKSNLFARSEPWEILCGQIVVVRSAETSSCSAAVVAVIEPGGDGPQRRFRTAPPPPVTQRPSEAEDLPWLSEEKFFPFYLLVKIIPQKQPAPQPSPRSERPDIKRLRVGGPAAWEASAGAATAVGLMSSTLQTVCGDEGGCGDGKIAALVDRFQDRDQHELSRHPTLAKTDQAQGPLSRQQDANKGAAPPTVPCRDPPPPSPSLVCDRICRVASRTSFARGGCGGCGSAGDRDCSFRTVDEDGVPSRHLHGSRSGVGGSGNYAGLGWQGDNQQVPSGRVVDASNNAHGDFGRSPRAAALATGGQDCCEVESSIHVEGRGCRKPVAAGHGTETGCRYNEIAPGHCGGSGGENAVNLVGQGLDSAAESREAVEAGDDGGDFDFSLSGVFCGCDEDDW